MLYEVITAYLLCRAVKRVEEAHFHVELQVGTTHLHACTVSAAAPAALLVEGAREDIAQIVEIALELVAVRGVGRITSYNVCYTKLLRLLPYQTLLSLHFLSIALLLVWFPFSKLFHVITVLPSRYILGVKFWRRGVEV